ncbi:hypothetical protein [Flexivirga lutea]
MPHLTRRPVARDDLLDRGDLCQPCGLNCPHRVLNLLADNRLVDQALTGRVRRAGSHPVRRFSREGVRGREQRVDRCIGDGLASDQKRLIGHGS